jgi:hypothetical protein
MPLEKEHHLRARYKSVQDRFLHVICEVELPQ